MSSRGDSYTIDGTSPMFRYSPHQGDGDGWAPLEPASRASEEEQGDSVHVTHSDGASVHLTFFGKGITLFGTANCSYDVTIDGSARDIGAHSSSVLYSTDKLSNVTHTLTLIAHPATGQALGVHKAVVALPFAVETRPKMVVSGTNTSLLSYNPPDAWSLPRADTTKRRAQSTTGVTSASASLNWTGGVAVEVNGVVSAVNGPYTVTLDDVTSTLNASSSWLTSDALLFFQAILGNRLDAHVLTITNAADSQLSIGSITLYGSVFFGSDQHETSDSSSTIPHHTNTGIIAGPVVGGVAVLGFAVLLLFFLRRRIVAKAEVSVVTPFDVRVSRTPQLEFTQPSPLDTDTTPHVAFAYPEPQRRPTQAKRKTTVPPVLPQLGSTRRSTEEQGESSDPTYRPTLYPAQSSPFDVERMMDMVAQRMDREGTRRPEPGGAKRDQE